MQENLPVERLVRKALRAEEPIGRPGIRQLGIPQGAKRLEERQRSPDGNMRGTDVGKTQNLMRGTDLKFSTRCFGSGESHGWATIHYRDSASFLSNISCKSWICC